MDERDLFRALQKDTTSRKEATELLSQLKTAGIKETAGRLTSKGLGFVAENKVPLIGAAIGTATATGLQYLLNKSKGGKPSAQRQSAEEGLAKKEKAMAEQKAKGKEPGFVSELDHARSKATADTARVLEKHPVKGALLAGPLGATAGYGLGKMVNKFLK